VLESIAIDPAGKAKNGRRGPNRWTLRRRAGIMARSPSSDPNADFRASDAELKTGPDDQAPGLHAHPGVRLFPLPEPDRVQLLLPGPGQLLLARGRLELPPPGPAHRRALARDLFDAAAPDLQPIPNLIFFLEFQAFHIDARAYYLFNIFVHSINAFLVYLLVRTMLKDRTIAVLSGLLFEFAVGNFGKSVMTASGISDLVITTMTLTTMIYYIKNELEERGRAVEEEFHPVPRVLHAFAASKTTSFLAYRLMLAFNLFYRDQTGRRVLRQ
jgi:hypothetical protein